ncbi:MAG TPA: PstS family phosphate ABC transporter substrate-binding protein [Cellvibrionaceae bacterium]
MKKLLTALACASSFTLLSPAALAARDNISAVGSSTVFPFAKVVSERFGRKGNFKAPKIEPTGTGGGFKEFCKGVGVEFPDVANASRRIKQSEYDACQAAGVKEIVEIKIGFDGIVFANSKKAPLYDLTTKEIYLALAKNVPDAKGSDKLIPNPYKTWKDINPSLPATAISVMGPPPTSGTRDAFVELVMEGGCNSYPFLKALKDTKKEEYQAACGAIREDGVYIEAGENDNLIVRKLEENVNALGIFGYSFLEQNADKVHGSKVGGKAPTFEAIADGSYIVSRPLFIYVKKQHVGMVPGIKEFIAEFTSEAAWGDEGYLSEKGLIPLPKKDRTAAAAAANALTVMKL